LQAKPLIVVVVPTVLMGVAVEARKVIVRKVVHHAISTKNSRRVARQAVSNRSSLLASWRFFSYRDRLNAFAINREHHKSGVRSMSKNSSSQSCSDCKSLDRRRFIKTVGSAAIVGVATPALFDSRFAHAAPATKSSAETAVKQFYNSLSEKQMLGMCFPFDHELRSRIHANWKITKPTIGDDFYNNEQRIMIDSIVRNVTSEEGYERLITQMDEDAGGIEEYSVAIFGEPGRGKFEWELTGRHLTLRADGDSVDKTAFGGPLIYGHGEEDPADNMYHYQTKQVNEVFQALDAKQAEQALVTKAPRENQVRLQGSTGTFSGLSVSDLSGDQKELVEATIKVLLAPYREEDKTEVMEIVKASGGVDQLHMAFYEQGDLEGDKLWDIWRLEGPSFVWHFRGAPHVHAYINIAQRT
jgi:Protein of unknown function (DUF3500)